MFGALLGRKRGEGVVDGTVFCSRRADRVDVERCYACPLQRRLVRDRGGEVVAVACAYGDWDRASVLTN